MEGERLAFGLAEIDGPGQGPINCGAVKTLSACRLAFKYLFNSRQPVNGGTFRPREVLTKPALRKWVGSRGSARGSWNPLEVMGGPP